MTICRQLTIGEGLRQRRYAETRTGAGSWRVAVNLYHVVFCRSTLLFGLCCRSVILDTQFGLKTVMIHVSAYNNHLHTLNIFTVNNNDLFILRCYNRNFYGYVRDK